MHQVKRFMSIKALALAFVGVASFGTCAVAQAGPRPAVVDSTGFVAGVVGTAIPVPVQLPQLTKEQICAMLGNCVATNGSAPGALPPGWAWHTYQTGPHVLGDPAFGTRDSQFPHYTAIPDPNSAYFDWPVSMSLTYFPPGATVNPWGNILTGLMMAPSCFTDSTPRVMVEPQSGSGGGTDAWGNYVAPVVIPGQAWACEPVGTYQALEYTPQYKSFTQYTLSNLTSADIAPYIIPGTDSIVASDGAANRICQGKGAIGFVPGTTVAGGTSGFGGGFNGGCSYSRTAWGISTFVLIQGCGTAPLLGAQCYQ